MTAYSWFLFHVDMGRYMSKMLVATKDATYDRFRGY